MDLLGTVQPYLSPTTNSVAVTTLRPYKHKKRVNKAIRIYDMMSFELRVGINIFKVVEDRRSRRDMGRK